MVRKGLTKEIIYKAAAELIVEKGYDNFSLRELAARLDVQPASLYSHVKNVEEINIAIGEKAIADMSDVLEKAIVTDDDDEAFTAFAKAYRKFAHKNPELYRAIMNLPGAKEKELQQDEQKTINPLRKLVERFTSDETEIINYQRILRSALHGFVMLESEGFMRSRKVSADESFNLMVRLCLKTIKNEK